MGVERCGAVLHQEIGHGQPLDRRRINRFEPVGQLHQLRPAVLDPARLKRRTGEGQLWGVASLSKFEEMVN